ncbi:MAG: hypothetical protein NVSMB25_03840 [Thermoleophilaceae bacterium]
MISLLPAKKSLRAPLLALVLLALMPASRAIASPTQATIMQDDRQLVSGSARQRAKRLDELQALGADIVKVRVNWRYIAPGGRRKPRRFDATNPAAYPARAWAPYDDLVRGAIARGMQVYMQLGSNAPNWATRGRPSAITRPNAGEFAKFVKAVGLRYSGSFGGPTPLPRVALWSVWNEPNLASWLAPQYNRRVPVAADIYRALVYGASDGLKASGHAGDQLLIGELLPFVRSGRTGNIKISPLGFLRQLACVDGHYRPFSGQAAAQHGCRRFKRLPGTGLAYHPYTLAGGPDVATPSRDDASIGNLARVVHALDTLSRRGRLESQRMALWITEFGFQTNPPDPYQSPLRRVPGFMGESEWIAYHNPRVVSYSQYPLVDDPSPRRGFGGFHSGLRYRNGKPKAGVYQAFGLPLYVVHAGSRVEVFGGVRGARSGSSVTIESRMGARGAFQTLATVAVNQRGYFDRIFTLSGAGQRQYRFRSPRGTSRTTPSA